MANTHTLIPGARQKRAASIDAEHERPLDLPCLACAGQGRLHSCEDFPLPHWTRDYLAAFDTLTVGTELPRYVTHREGGVIPTGTSIDPRLALSLMQSVRPETKTEQHARWTTEYPNVYCFTCGAKGQETCSC